MRKRILSAIISAAMLGSLFGAFALPASAATAKTPKYYSTARKMEMLNRGLVAVYKVADGTNVTTDEAGVYLSWRLLGTEDLTNQAFDIYRRTTSNGKFSKIATTGVHDATNYTDKKGKTTYAYKVVPAGADADTVAAEPFATPQTNHVAQAGKSSLVNSFTYMDIPIVRPDPVPRMGDGRNSLYYTYKNSNNETKEGGANDASVGDLDGDGDYEIVLKWDPDDSKDSAGADFTGNVYIDAYEIDPNNGGYKWRIDLGPNVTAGAHYTQFIVYDFDGDGKAEMACKTAPGSIDGTGHYVSEVGDTDAIRDVDNTAQFIGTSGKLKGKNPFTQYLTVFDGETGAALATTEYIPYNTFSSWGDSQYNRSERYLAGVAYLDGVTPSIIMCRGYYNQAALRAYNWDGKNLTMLWEHKGGSSSATSMYGNGNHQLSISDIDDDGKDEIVYGSVALDDDGKNAMGNTFLGHGDAMHVSDFNNDGIQECFSVKEDSEGFKHYAEDLRVVSTGKHFWADGKITTSGDNGRGVMANVDDAYAKTHPNALALGWSSGKDKIHDLNGDDVAAKPASAGNGSFDNSLVYWDGDLGRELLDSNIIQKYDASTGYTTRFWGESDGYTLTGGSTNNYTKRNACLTADLWGDWREEIIMATGKAQDASPALRIFTSTIPTEYRLTTLMHDSQYRQAIAWQNVGYNQPPHQSYYIGSAALATDENGNEINYLAPDFKYTKVEEVIPEYTKKQLYTSNGFASGKAGFTGGTVTDGVLTGTAYNNLKLEYNYSGNEDDYVNVNSIKVNKASKKATASLTNFSHEDFGGAIVTASYDNGKVQSVKSADLSLSAGETKEVELDTGNGANIKTMLWDGLDTMTPLTDTVTETKTEIKNEKIKQGSSAAVEVEFDWLPGDDVKLATADDANILTLSKESGGAVKYTAGTGEAAVFDSSLKNDNAWYHVKAIIDPTSSTADVTITDKTNGGYPVEVIPISIEGGCGTFNRIGITNSSIDNVTVSKRAASDEREYVKFNVTDDNGAAVSDATITIGTQTFATNSEGEAIAKLPKGHNNYTVRKSGYQKTTGSVETEDAEKNIVLGDSEPSSIMLKYMYGSTEIKTSEKIGEAYPDTTYNVDLADSYKADIAYNGNVYEYNPDSTKTSVVVSEDGDTNVTLAFKPKTVPASDGTEIAHLYLTENGTGYNASDADAYWTGGDEFGTASGVRYITATDAKPVTVSFANTSANIVMEYDMMIKSMDGGGDVFGAVPYSGDTKGLGVGWRRDSTGSKFAPAKTKNQDYFGLVQSTYNTAATYQNKWTHVIMVCANGQISTTYASLSDGTVYVNDETYDSGLGSNPINKLVFGRGYGSGTGEVAVRSFKAYTMNISGSAEATTEDKTLDIPSTTSFKPSAYYPSEVNGVNVNASPLMGAITYELQNTDGTAATDPTGISLDAANGTVTVTDELSELDTYKLVVSLDGSPWKTYNLSFRAKQIIESVETFDDGLNGFTITSGKTGYALEHTNGMVKYTKTAGTANDNSVYLTYPITTASLGDKYELSYDFNIVSAAFKGYTYFTNTAGGELMRMETHLYTPRMKVPSGTGTVDFMSNSVETEKFVFDHWYTLVYSYENGTATINIYEQDDTNHEYPLVETEPITVSNAANGAIFKMQVAQNIQNGSADNADEYYFDNFRYSYYAY